MENKPEYHKMLIRTPKEVLRCIQKEATKKGISVTTYVNLILQNHLEAPNKELKLT